MKEIVNLDSWEAKKEPFWHDSLKITELSRMVGTFQSNSDIGFRVRAKSKEIEEANVEGISVKEGNQTFECDIGETGQIQIALSMKPDNPVPRTGVHIVVVSTRKVSDIEMVEDSIETIKRG